MQQEKRTRAATIETFGLYVRELWILGRVFLGFDECGKQPM